MAKLFLFELSTREVLLSVGSLPSDSSIEERKLADSASERHMIWPFPAYILASFDELAIVVKQQSNANKHFTVRK